MGSAAHTLTETVNDDNRYDYCADDIRELQIAAINERFQERKDVIRLLGHRADEAGLTEVRSLEDAALLLFPHTAYKSYPESFLAEERWDRLTKWLNTVSAHPIEGVEFSGISGVDDWLSRLEARGHYVSCSSGTTGKSAMLVASQKDMDWVQNEAVKAYTWGSGVQSMRDRRMFALAAVAAAPRARNTGVGYKGALQDPAFEPFDYPVPPLTVGALTEMVVLRKKVADGTARPEELVAYDKISAERQKYVDDAVGLTARALIEARQSKLHVTGLWAGLYNVAKAVRDLGYSAKDFHPENSIYVGGGLKRAVLPDNYREFVYETFNIAPDRNYQNYSMQELHSGMPRCQKGNRYHLPPWLVPIILNKEGDARLPNDGQGQVEGRAAYFDLSLDGRWGGVITGDKVTIDYSPCACGARGPSITDNVVRYADIEGDDKIGCAGTVDAYVRGVS